MSGIEVILWFSLAALLFFYARIKHHQFLHRPSEPHDPAEWTGKSIDVTDLKPKLEYLRRNYVAACPPVKGACFHRALVELARRTVAQLGYFQEKAPEEHAQMHEH